MHLENSNIKIQNYEKKNQIIGNHVCLHDAKCYDVVSYHFYVPNISLLSTRTSVGKQPNALAEGEFTYNIYNETGNLISEGILNCNCNDSQTIDLGFYYSGTYYIVVTYNGHAFGGAFEIYE